MMLNRYIVLIILIFSFSKIYATPPKKHILKEYATSMLHKKDKDGGYITAISITTQCGKKLPVSVVAGTVGIHDATPIAENSLFQIGSITKSFVSLVILELADEHNINIDDNTIIRKWFPEYPRWGNITLRQLMNMTSGIPGNSNQLPDDIFKKFTAEEYFEYSSPTKLLNLTYQLPLHFKPGSQFEYSNSNYILLGQFIQKITHHAPGVEIYKRIINPLGLKHTYFVVDKENEIPGIGKKQLVHGYAFQSPESHPYPWITYGADTLPFSLSNANASGAMISTPQDINLFAHSIFSREGIFHKYQQRLTTFVSKKTGKSIKAPTATDRQGFGLGIIGFYWNAKHPFIYAYNGEMDGFNFAWLMDPTNQNYFVVAINSHADILGLDDALQIFQKLSNHCKI